MIQPKRKRTIEILIAEVNFELKNLCFAFFFIRYYTPKFSAKKATIILFWKFKRLKNVKVMEIGCNMPSNRH